MQYLRDDTITKSELSLVLTHTTHHDQLYLRT